MKAFFNYTLTWLIIFVFILLNQTNLVSAEVFKDGDLFVASTILKQIRVYNSETLEFKYFFTHELFNLDNCTDYNYKCAPNGMAINKRGNLIVSSYTHFVEFISSDNVYSTYKKNYDESNENIIFDKLGNLYTTTSTGGSDKLNQYNAADYSFNQTINLPNGSGQLTGITFDYNNRLFVGSQSDQKIHVLIASDDFSTFTHSHSFSSINQTIEGIQFNLNSELVAAGGANGDFVRYNPDNGDVIGRFDITPDITQFPHTMTVDNLGRIFVADFESGSGNVASDIIRFSHNGSNAKYINDTDLKSPMGIVVYGTNIPGSHEFDCPDSDGDGVPDKWDKCLNTPDNSYVNKNGCALNGIVIDQAQADQIVGCINNIIKILDEIGLKDAIKALEISAGIKKKR